MHQLRKQREMIDVTYGGMLGGVADTHRKFAPGPWSYWLTVDGVDQEIDRETFDRLRAENDQ